MWSISCHITPLVINSLSSGHTHMQIYTHTHTYRYPQRNNFKKPGMIMLTPSSVNVTIMTHNQTLYSIPE